MILFTQVSLRIITFNPNLAIDMEFAFKLIPNSLDNDDAKLIDTFYRCLCSAHRTDLFVEVISDRKNG